jgi:alkylation response protein AidB-like acyl-CoA dehydrogenase
VLDRAARDEPLSLLERARIGRDHGFMGRLLMRAVDRLFDGAGAHALYDANPLQRFQRDVRAACHHAGLFWDTRAEVYGRVRLGLDPGPDARL